MSVLSRGDSNRHRPRVKTAAKTARVLAGLYASVPERRAVRAALLCATAAVVLAGRRPPPLRVYGAVLKSAPSPCLGTLKKKVCTEELERSFRPLAHLVHAWLGDEAPHHSFPIVYLQRAAGLVHLNALHMLAPLASCPASVGLLGVDADLQDALELGPHPCSYERHALSSSSAPLAPRSVWVARPSEGRGGKRVRNEEHEDGFVWGHDKFGNRRVGILNTGAPRAAR